eukprot:6764989-Pyramimonas_sp.AAC.1
MLRVHERLPMMRQRLLPPWASAVSLAGTRLSHLWGAAPDVFDVVSNRLLLVPRRVEEASPGDPSSVGIQQVLCVRP